MNKRTVIVTGANGLIGNQVAKKLARSRQVVALDVSEDESQLSELNNVTYIQSDLAGLDLTKLETSGPPGYLIHCAAHPGGKSLEEPVRDAEVNAYATMRLFSWAANHNVEVVYLSSSAIYGEQPDHPLNEQNSLPDPNTVYAVYKVANERILKILEAGYGLRWTVLRLFATYGAGHKPNTFQGIVNIMLTQLMEGDEIVVKGSLARVRSLLYVDDAAEAIICALENKSTRGEIINVAYPEPQTISEIIREIQIQLNKSNINIDEQAGTVGDTFYNYADTTKMTTLLEFQPENSLADGLKKLIKHRQEN